MTLWRALPFPKYLLVLVPAAMVLHFGHLAGPVAQFLVAAGGILGLVVVIGMATEEVAMRLGPVWGGLLNATFGNVTELIIALMALGKGAYTIVRASITGSILGNSLLLLGVAMLAGGIRHKTQTFSRTSASTSVQMLAVSLFALVIPSVTGLVFRLEGLSAPDGYRATIEHLSLSVALVLLLVYVLHLVFSLYTHRFTFRTEEGAHEQPKLPLWLAVTALLGTVVLVALTSDVFVAALDEMVRVTKVPVSEMFLGVVVVAVVGNAAEGSVAITAAYKGKMELAFQVAMSSALQIALLVGPLLVVLSFVIAERPMTMAFSPFELLALWAGMLISAFTLQDGESNWFEGAMLVAVYLCFALVFFFHP
jgi:Ca2+:H+ antiporter